MTFSKPAASASPVHEVIRNRWSPRAYDTRAVEPEKLRSLFEAARWAASSGNQQPWFYIVATKDDPENFQKVLSTLVETNQVWAKNAPVLALSAARTLNEQTGKPNRHAFHDVGAASATLALEASALGLEIHQMGGVLPDKAREVFGIPEGFEVVAGIALGYPGDPNSLAEKLKERELAPRTRKPESSFVFTGSWNHTAPFVSKE